MVYVLSVPPSVLSVTVRWKDSVDASSNEQSIIRAVHCSPLLLQC